MRLSKKFNPGHTFNGSLCPRLQLSQCKRSCCNADLRQLQKYIAGMARGTSICACALCYQTKLLLSYHDHVDSEMTKTQSLHGGDLAESSKFSLKVTKNITRTWRWRRICWMFGGDKVQDWPKVLLPKP